MKKLISIFGAVTGLLIASRYRREIRAARERVNGKSRIVRLPVCDVEYAERGRGPAALVIHGAGGGYDQGLLIGQNFTGFQVIAPSRFGYLNTPTPSDISPAAQADAYAALLDSLGIEKAVVAGVSAGAPSAVQLALRYPSRVRALILIVPRGYAPGRPTDAPATHEAILRAVLSGADFAYWAAMRLARRKVVQFLGVPPELEARQAPAERQRVNAIMESVLPLSMRIEGIRNDSATSIGPLPLERVQAPTLIVTAKDDLFDTRPAAEHLEADIPGAKLVVLEDGGHLMVGRQAEVDAAIADSYRA